jgi:hypothetical protein
MRENGTTIRETLVGRGVEVANRTEGMSSRGRFATPADLLL